MSIQFSDNVKMLDAVSSTTTSQAFDVSKRQLVSIQFNCDTYSSGSGVFTVNASNDGVNWDNSISVLDAGATATGTSVLSETLTSASPGSNSVLVLVNPSFRYLTVTCTIIAGGTYSAILQSKG